MKTQKIGLLFLMALLLLIVSCKKELSVPTGTSNSISPSDQTVGSILDLGVIDANVHHMIVTLNDVSLSITGEPVLNAGVESSKISIDLLTNSDGIISDGTYAFSNSSDYAPFTFHSAAIMMPNQETNSPQAYNLNGGSINISRDGISYTITLQGSLESGNNFQGTFGGALSYGDVVPNY